MSLSHFLYEYAENPALGPYYDHWLTGGGNFGTFGHIWHPDWSLIHPNTPRTPPVEWHEQETLYTVHIEVPGVRKEDITMHVADDGKSLNIEGKVDKFGGASSLRGLTSGEKERVDRPRLTKVRKTMADGSTVIISRLEKKHNVGTTVKFSRTISLPDYVDGKRVAARLENGILTITIPKLSTPSPKPRRIVID
ncbi:heat shock protein HSP20 family protein [Ceratobasidium sp. AG-Ba]|nr:heat shock protein HSP20 family protein [Ceratobasidium sp. AG-Ba]QRW15329.1 heat shock protein HSP20 family protein [Ceratobasidium sp. AG-Ba]